MTGRWDRLQSLFHEGSALPVEQRKAFLRIECPDDPELVSEVLRLIECHEELEHLPAEAQNADPRIGQRVGAYRLDRLLGRGGMGAVYLASRQDGQFTHQAAVKLMGGPLVSGHMADRFRQERQILASLSHPNVARLLDGGLTGEGAPYLVMEYIDGRPLDAWCDERGLRVRERLRLFVAVCEAIQYVHQNLVIHRDLKPGNILVTADGEPKVVDFGTAKLLEGEGLTVAGMNLLTPSYASPEQLEGRAVTTLSDVYSLGLVLCRLLTGKLPYRSGDSPAAALREVTAHEPIRPSALAADRERARVLRSDLDHVVLKALEKEPGRRYQSAEQLADDVRRYLAGDPVTARSGSTAYRAVKFIRRHRAAMGAVSVAVVGLLSGLLLALHEAQVAETERRKAEGVNRILTRMLDAANPSFYSSYRGDARDARIVDLLDGASRQIDAELDEEPAVAAALGITLGASYFNLGINDKAQQLLEAALAKQIEVAGEQHRDTARALSLLGSSYWFDGDAERGEAYYRRAMAIVDRLGDPTDSLRFWLPADLARIYSTTGRQAEARELALLALRRAREGWGERSLAATHALNPLGWIYYAQGDLEEARQAFTEMVEIFDEQAGPPVTEYAWALEGLGVLTDIEGDSRQAEQLFRRATAILTKALGENHPWTANSRVNVADMAAELGDFETAERLLEESLAVLRQRPEHLANIQALRVRGHLLANTGRPAEGEPLLRKALEGRERVHGRRDYRTATCLRDLGACLIKLGRFEEGRSLMEEARVVLSGTVGDSDPRTVRVCRLIEDADAGRELGY